MPSHYGENSNPNQPAQDLNIQTPAAQSTGTANPPIPADHAQQTPEFLQKLIMQLNQFRQEQSELFAKMYPPMSARQAGPPVRPPYEELEELKRQDEEYDRKISALKMQIQELRTLLARPAPQPKPELEQVPGPTQPPTPEPAERGA
jgi:hypothetical protein